MMMMVRKPLMLKDYLELDDDDDSESVASSGLASVPTIRCLLDAELRSGAARLVHAAQSNKITRSKFCAAINAVKLLPFSSSDGRCLPGHEGSLSRSISRRLRSSLWKKKEKKADQQATVDSRGKVRDIVQQRSFDENGEGWKSLRFPSPVASSLSSWSETESCGTASDLLPASMASWESLDENADSAGGRRTEAPSRGPNPNDKSEKKADDEKSDGEAIASRSAKVSGGKEMQSSECNSEEEDEEEKLSPVSVIDYPYQQENGHDDDEEQHTTTTFHRSLANIERTKEQLLRRIRRFEMLAELDPGVLSASSSEDDLQESINHGASSGGEGEEERAWGLLGELKASPLEEGPRGSMEKLLLDFFIQGQCRSSCANRNRPLRWGHTRPPALRGETREMLNTARDWIDGRRYTDLDDVHGEATLREMEENGRWRCFDEVEEELGMHLGNALFESAVEELVQDLVSR
ncbi:hypothetical protein MUK42_29881 [Musa troglodytarum]|uniref:DUF4378 domain-containing protein n=1 Tax=Musa troglodytarum TaxID=320322 RepID=A0A9E7FH56_9LILI|nr:hypothetical protein MUK42_29881 [Musa troglodytarum]